MLAVFPDAFPDACRVSGCVSGNNLWIPLCYIASGGSKISKKHVLWIPFCYLASGGSKISKKTRPGKQTRIYCIYSPSHIYIVAW